MIQALLAAAPAIMNMAGSLFGKKKTSGQTITPEQLMPDFQTQAGKDLGGWVNQYLKNFTPGQAYNGDFTAGMTGMEQQGLGDLQSWMNQGSTGDLFNAGKQQVMDTLGGKYIDPNTSPYIKAMTNLAQINLGDAINNSRASAGSRGTYFTKNAVKQESDLSNRSLANLQSIIGSYMQNERQNQLGAATTAQNMDQYGNITAPLAKVQASQTLGGLERTIQQADLEARYNDFKRQRTEQAMPIQAAQSLYGTDPRYGIGSITGPDTVSNNGFGSTMNILSKLNLGSMGGSGDMMSKILGMFNTAK